MNNVNNSEEEFDLHELGIAPQVFTGPMNTLLKGAQYWSLKAGSAASANFQTAWSLMTGKGVTVSIVDEGVNYTHLGLTRNYSTDIDFDPRDEDGGWDAMPDSASHLHGTEVAGVVSGSLFGSAASAIGAAPGATITASYLRYGASVNMAELTEILAQQSKFDVSNNSWGFTTAFADNFGMSYFSGLSTQLARGAQEGRDGLGTAFVVAGGNAKMNIAGENYGDDSNFHNLSNSRYVIAVGAHDAEGDAAFFSSPGTNLLISAPGVGLITTTGTANGSDSSTYVSGTSFAAPLVSSAIALMLEANSHLGYRDIQEILAITATSSTASGAAANGARNVNGGGMIFDREMGFGALNAEAAVKLARYWDKTSTAANEAHIGASFSLPEAFDGTSQSLQLTLESPDASGFSVDFVELTLDISDAALRNLSIELVSPTGTRALIAPNLNVAGSKTTLSFTFSSVATWGENPYGTWTLNLRHSTASSNFEVRGATLDVYGDVTGDDDTFYFTQAFSRTVAADPSRAIIVDDDGGINTLNFAAASGPLVLDLSGRTASVLSGVELQLQGNFHKAVGTTFNDVIRGSAGDDLLIGDLGNDTLAGGAGADQLIGGAGRDTASYATAVKGVVANLSAPAKNTGDAAGDTYSSIENLIGSKYSDKLAGNGKANIIKGGAGNDTLYGVAGNDRLEGGAGRDKLVGGADNDKLYGGDGNDALYGGSGRDMLYGGYGKDKLFGGSGNDKLCGNAGADKLLGGAGADTFVFNSVKDSTVSASGRDTIYDFSRKQGDKISLKGIDANTDTRADNAFKFIGSEKFHHENGELRYQKKGGDTYIYGDVDGDGRADFSIKLDMSITLKATDFIL